MLAATTTAIVLRGDADHPLDESPVPIEQEIAPPATADDLAAPSDLEALALATLAIHEPEAAPAFSPSSAAPPVATEPLDFSSLVTRLRKTKAINLKTKVAVKNESDDLLEEFRAYHTQRGMTTLSELRRSYDSLFHKLHSLLQDTDPPLARDIDRSRTAIWELLADPRKFSASHLLAGA